MALLPEADGEATRLAYTVNAQIGGKIAQLGSRLIDGASKKMADDFFEAFRVAIAPLTPDALADAALAASGGTPAGIPAATGEPHAPGVPATTGALPRQWRWLLVAVALVAMAAWYLLARK